MNALSTRASEVTYCGPPPVLIAASSAEAMASAERSVEASGLRVGGRLAIDEVGERLDRQGQLQAIWIELDRDGGTLTSNILKRVSRDVESERYRAVVSTKSALIDLLPACLHDCSIELLVDADEAERVAALATALASGGLPLRLSDVSSDRNAERLRQLSEEVNRIASTLAQLSTSPLPLRPALVEGGKADVPHVSLDAVRNVIRARRLRGNYFSEGLFADPAWDMMLDLLRAEIAHLRVPVSSLCIAAAVPPTTALRWLKSMVRQGLFVRQADPHDGRRVYVELAPETSQSLRRYFDEVGRVTPI
ncbi:hypothetical protein ACUXST_001728 [Sphingomonas sp. F9_3S_D5_B_2]